MRRWATWCFVALFLVFACGGRSALLVPGVAFVTTDGAGGSGAGGSGASGAPEQGGAGGAIVKPPECVVYESAVAVVPLDLFMLLDASGSMAQALDQSYTKWSAVGDALTFFMTAPESGGMTVALTFFPIIDESVPRYCSALLSCPDPEWCKPAFVCAEAGGFCSVDEDCQDDDHPDDVCVPLKTCTTNPYPCTEPSSCLSGQCELGGTCDDRYTCEAAAYATTVFGPSELPGAANGFLQKLHAQQPLGGTPTLPALRGVLSAARNRAKALPSHKVVVLMATDGAPTVCDHDLVTGDDTSGIAGLVEAAAEATAEGVDTFAIGVFTESEAEQAQSNLDLVAEAGGGEAIVITTEQPVTQALIKALEAVRAEARACEFELPPSEDPIDYTKVWVRLAAAVGGALWAERVDGPAACHRQLGGFHYNTPSTESPTRVVLCPATCALLDEAEFVVELYTECSDPMSG